MKPAPSPATAKVRRYREAQKRAGFVEFRAWVPKEGVDEMREHAAAVTRRCLRKRKDGPADG